ncbi:MAG: hypothetical protein COV36_05455 [Alphaproteobacteria bacterium CG11_big_fil_rev_8_21_14_0_20_44_7]|nr:MAG: hypothetical protein COV36_05455 [Alphaproteobacteria bacterium CG11_big_fil_rev_8_21_14_0_20_44_7]
MTDEESMHIPSGPPKAATEYLWLSLDDIPADSPYGEVLRNVDRVLRESSIGAYYAEIEKPDIHISEVYDGAEGGGYNLEEQKIGIPYEKFAELNPREKNVILAQHYAGYYYSQAFLPVYNIRNLYVIPLLSGIAIAIAGPILTGGNGSFIVGTGIAALSAAIVGAAHSYWKSCSREIDRTALEATQDPDAVFAVIRKGEEELGVGYANARIDALRALIKKDPQKYGASQKDVSGGMGIA